MRLGIDYGLEHLDLDVSEGCLVGSRRQPPPAALEDPAAALREALERPLGFPALRRALTPDDHVVVVLDERVPHLSALLVPLLEHIAQARVAPSAITFLCPPGSSQHWVNDLPPEFQDVHVEVHDPTDRRQLSYLATTRKGRRLYLNRTAVDADQLVVLGRRGYDPLLGYSGGEGALFPALSDEATRHGMYERLSLAAPGGMPWPAQQEAAEVAWLLGAPFLVQIIEGTGEDVVHIVSGPVETSAEAVRLLEATWRMDVDGPADVVVASVPGDPGRLTCADLARALGCAARVVKGGGRIVLLSQATPEMGPGTELLRQAETPKQGLDLLRKHTPADMAAAFEWASAAHRATLYLLSGLPAETAEELFAVPLDHAGQVQRLLRPGQTCLFIADAHKTMAVSAS